MLEHEPKNILDSEKEEENRLVQENFEKTKKNLKLTFDINYEDLPLRAKRTLMECVKTDSLREKKEREDFTAGKTKSMSMGHTWDEGMWRWVAYEYGISRLINLPNHWRVPDEKGMENARAEVDIKGWKALDKARDRRFDNKTDADAAAKQNSRPENRIPQWFQDDEDEKKSIEIVRDAILKDIDRNMI